VSALQNQPALVRRDVDMQLFSLLMNASLCITASCHARSGTGLWARGVQDLPAGRYKENKKILLILLILSKNSAAGGYVLINLELENKCQF